MPVTMLDSKIQEWTLLAWDHKYTVLLEKATEG